MNEVTLHIYAPCLDSPMPLPYADEGIKAGFPSPAQDYLTDAIDLNEVMVPNPETTFYARVDGDSMIDDGINDGDIVVIDKSLDARNGDLIAAYLDGEFTLKRLCIDRDGCGGWLVPANRHFHKIRVTADDDFKVWGVVTGIVRRIR